jgi:hypothetical protein
MNFTAVRTEEGYEGKEVRHEVVDGEFFAFFASICTLGFIGFTGFF